MGGNDGYERCYLTTWIAREDKSLFIFLVNLNLKSLLSFISEQDVFFSQEARGSKVFKVFRNDILLKNNKIKVF